MREAKTLLTADQLFHLPDDGFRYELVKGELRRMPPAGGEHGAIVMRLSLLLGRFIQDNALGVALGTETGFLIGTDPDTVRAPDFAFVRHDRVPEDGIPEGFWPGPPDLAVEVISPTDTYAAIEEKVTDWLQAGTRMVMVVNPRTRTVTVYHSPAGVTRLTEADLLAGGEVLPGFSCPVSSLFV